MPLETNPKLIEFIQKARAMGYEDYNIRIPLLEKGWPLDEVQRAFMIIKEGEEKNKKKKEKLAGKVVYRYKNSLMIHLDSEVFKIVERRAKKNMLTAPEQVEDIIRRSCVNVKKNSATQDNVDDLLLKLFSRKKNNTIKVKNK